MSSDDLRHDERIRPMAPLVLLVLGSLGFALLAAFRVPWHWLPEGASLPRLDAADYFTRAQLRRADSYSESQCALSLSGYAASLLVACALGFTPLGGRLLGRLRGWWSVRVVAGVLLLLLLGEVATLPFSLLLRRNAVRAGLTRQGLGGWLRDDLLSLLVTTTYTAIGALVLIGLARRLPRAWPLVAGVLSGLLVVLGSFVYPLLVEPLFNTFAPLPDGALRRSILRLADEEGVRVDGVLVADASRRTTTLNAYVTGFGSTRRVVLYDNTVNELDRAEIESVVAHELGHAKHNDVLLGTVLGACGAAFGVGLLALLVQRPGVRRRTGVTGISDPRSLALLLALGGVGTFLASPIENAVSRAIEARADRTALEITHDPAAFEAMQRRLALAALAQPQPPRLVQLWFGSHPTTLQRIGMAKVLGAAAEK